MPREFNRSQRMAEQIRRELAEIVRDELKDPRMGLFSITDISPMASPEPGMASSSAAAESCAPPPCPA